MTKTKFELDKVYKTLDGRDARVICVDAPDIYPIVGLVGNVVMRWSVEGLVNPEMHRNQYRLYPRELDLMLPKPEPIVEWGRLAPDGTFHPCASEAIARKDGLWPRPGEASWPIAKRTTEIIED